LTKKTGNPLGRPKKVANAVGRPKGEATVMKEYRARMLNSPKSPKVLDSIFSAALDDDHKHQAAAWKLIVDRIVPVSGFEADTKANRGGIEINITGLATTVTAKIDPIEAEFVEVKDE